MSEQEFERYLKMLGGFLGLDRRQREAIATELRDHFDERLDELRAAGLSRDEAIAATLEEFGDASGLAQQFAELARNRRRKRFVRFTTFSVSSITIALVLLFAMWPEHARVPLTRSTVAQAETPDKAEAAAADADEVAEADRKVIAALGETADIEFIETPFTEVLEFLMSKYKLDIDVDRGSLEAGGVALDVPVTMQMKNARLRSTLNRILHGLRLQWAVKDGAIVVRHEGDVAPLLVNRIYNVRDLVATVDISDVPDVVLPLIIDLLTSMTGRPTPNWQDAGGEGNARVAVDDLIVVSQTTQVHEQIAELLAALRHLLTIRDKKQAVGATSLAVAQPAANEMALQKKVAEACVPVEFVETPLNEVLQFFATKQQIPIQFDRRSADDHGIAFDTPVTFKLRGAASFQRVFQRLLRSLQLTFIIRDDVLLVIPHDENSHLITRIYPAWDLVGDDRDKVEVSLRGLVELIESTTGRDGPGWEEEGGQGAVRYLAGLASLVVCTSPATHEQIESLISRMRQSRKKLAAMPKPVTNAEPEDRPTLRTYSIPNANEEGTPVASPDEVAAAIETILLAETPADRAPVKISKVSSRLLIIATPAIHKRIDKILTKELRGLLERFETNSIPSNGFPGGVIGTVRGGGGGGFH